MEDVDAHQTYQYAGHAAFVTLPIGSAAMFIYLTRLWVAFAWITSDYLRAGCATNDATPVHDTEVSDGGLGDKCRVIDLVAWRAERRRKADRRESGIVDARSP
jgi:hypothetical protein